MAKVIAFLVMVLAAMGVVGCIFTSFAVAVNPAIEKSLVAFLGPGVFVVCVPTIFLMNYMTKDFKRDDIWKAALRGCPRWMKMALWIVVGLTWALFLIPTFHLRMPAKFPLSFTIFLVSFYSVSFCVAYSLLHVEAVDASRRCLNGHQISPLAKYCEECGSPARETERVR